MRKHQRRNQNFERLTIYRHEKAKMISDQKQVTVRGPKTLSTTWDVIDDIKEADVDPLSEYYHKQGIKGFDFGIDARSVSNSKGQQRRINLLALVRHLWPGEEINQLDKMNEHRKKMNDLNESRRHVKVKPFIRQEFWTFWGLILASRVVGDEIGEKMWQSKRSEGLSGDEKHFDASKYMSLKRFKEMKTAIPHMYADETRKQEDPWWQVILAIEQFNENRSRTVASSNVNVMDESMSAFKPQTTATGNLPHLSFVKRKPEPLGTEFKDNLDQTTEIMKMLRLCRKRTDTTDVLEYRHMTTKKTAQVSLDIMKKSMHKPEHDLPNDPNVNPNATKDIFLGDAWFASFDLAFLAAKELKCHFIGVIKTNSGRYPKKFLQDTMKQWPSGSHLLLQTVLDGQTIYVIGYKYCQKKTLMFIFTDGAGHTEPGIPYVAKWNDDNSNKVESHIPRPAVVSFYFEKCNGIDVHNQQRQKQLRLEKCWVTEDGYFRILTTMFGITVVDAWRAYRHHTRLTHRHHNIELM